MSTRPTSGAAGTSRTSDRDGRRWPASGTARAGRGGVVEADMRLGRRIGVGSRAPLAGAGEVWHLRHGCRTVASSTARWRKGAGGQVPASVEGPGRATGRGAGRRVRAGGARRHGGPRAAVSFGPMTRAGRPTRRLVAHRPDRLTPEQARRRWRAAASPARRRTGRPRRPWKLAVPGDPGPGQGVRAGHRLHGRRPRHRPGGARVVWRRHQDGAHAMPGSSTT